MVPQEGFPNPKGHRLPSLPVIPRTQLSGLRKKRLVAPLLKIDQHRKTKRSKGRLWPTEHRFYESLHNHGKDSISGAMEWRAWKKTCAWFSLAVLLLGVLSLRGVAFLRLFLGKPKNTTEIYFGVSPKNKLSDTPIGFSSTALSGAPRSEPRCASSERVCLRRASRRSSRFTGASGASNPQLRTKTSTPHAPPLGEEPQTPPQHHESRKRQ